MQNLLNPVARRAFITFLLAGLMLLQVSGFWTIPFLHNLDRAIYDWRVNYFAPRTLDERIVIIDVDEKSLSEIGQWPWNRGKIAELIDELSDRQKTSAIGLDTLFAETDASSTYAALKKIAQTELKNNTELNNWLEKNQAKINSDTQLAETIAKTNTTLGYYFTSDRSALKAGKLPEPLMQITPPPRGLYYWDGYGASIATLTDAAKSSGFINSSTSSDGIIRKVPLIAEFENGIYQSLSISLLKQSIQNSILQIKQSGQPSQDQKNSSPIKEIKIINPQGEDTTIPLNIDGTIDIAYRGEGGVNGGSFQYIPAADILKKRLKEGELEGKIAILGFTAPGLMDLRSTPVGQAYPGVEVHANIISSILDKRIYTRPHWDYTYRITIFGILSLILIFWLPKLNPVSSLMAGLTMLTALIAINLWLYLHLHLILPVAPALFLTITAMLLNLSMGYFTERYARRTLAKQFATYVPPELVRQMEQDPAKYTMQAKAEELTIMFCDLRGFTTLSERISPLELQKLLNEILSRFSQAIRQNQGTIDKYMGDCVMAFWGAPIAMKNHASLAVKAAIEMSQTLEEFNQQRRQAGETEIQIGIGLNTGIVSVGNMGSDVRRAYTVMGDAVNLASRLEGVTRYFDTQIILSDTTKAQIKALGDLPEGTYLQTLPDVQVKGRKKPVSISTIRTHLQGDTPEKVQKEIKEWEEIIKAWKSGELAICNTKVAKLLKMNANYCLYKKIQERVTLELNNPSKSSWDGTIIFDEK